MDQILLVLFVETCRYLSPFNFLVETCRQNSPQQAFGNSDKSPLHVQTWALDLCWRTRITFSALLVSIVTIRRVSFYSFSLRHWKSIASFQQAHGTWNEWYYVSPRTSETQWGWHCWSIIVIARSWWWRSNNDKQRYHHGECSNQVWGCGSSVYVACICQEIHDGLLLTSGMFIHIFNEEEMNDINLDDSTFMYSKQILGCAKIYKSRTSYWYNGPVCTWCTLGGPPSHNLDRSAVYYR